MNRFYMKVRTAVLKTSLGKKTRYIMQKLSYKEEDAKKIIAANYPSLSVTEQAAVAKDMMIEAKKYNVGFDEYVMYHFKDRPQEERRAFIPTRERALYCERLNKPENQMIFDDKGETFRVFKKFFKRDLTEVVGWNEESRAALKAFVSLHPRFIIKPFNGGNGRGIQIIDTATFTFEELCENLKKQYPSGFVAEELIVQAKELAEFHPASVNTLRIFTILFDDRIELLPVSWRVGRGGACVDNGGSGGIFCVLNNDGEVISTCDEKGNTFEKHPDTNKALIGFKVPRFDEAVALAKELATVVPTNRYCGWDLALTDDGWVMQEGNWQGGIVAFQCPMQRGYRKEMDAIMNELNL